MTPHAFIEKWRASQLKERSASQEQFIDLCHLLSEPTPAEADPSGETYCFERGARKDTGGDGWADVWKRHHSAWEYKGQRVGLDAAFDQLRQYSLVLENPPLPIVSDMVRFRTVAQASRERGHDPQAVAHFGHCLVFCMFGDAVGLLACRMFNRRLRLALRVPKPFTEFAGELFRMIVPGAPVGYKPLAWSNGGLFDGGVPHRGGQEYFSWTRPLPFSALR